MSFFLNKFILSDVAGENIVDFQVERNLIKKSKLGPFKISHLISLAKAIISKILSILLG